MEIKFNDTNKKVTFGELREGDLFVLDDRLMIKRAFWNRSSDKYNSLFVGVLEGGNNTFEDQVVKPVKALEVTL